MSLTVAFLGIAAMGLAQDPTSIPYDHLETGFQFSYSRDWKLTKQRDHITFSIPFADVGRAASLEVYGVMYSNDIPTWQAIQVNAAKQLKHEVAKQWQEEILTVPMLMARTQWDAKGTSRTADMALIYANTTRKLAFRLTADTQDFSRADEQFRSLLQTLKMANGGLPKPYDPSKPASESLTRPDRGGDIGVWKRPIAKPAPVIFGDSSVETSASAIALLVKFASPWKATADGDGLKFSHSDVLGDIKARAFTALEADPAGKALIKASAVSLEPFKSATSEIVGPLLNHPASTYAYIWRQGTAADGAKLYSLDGVVATGDYYVILHWDSKDVKTADRAKKRVLELLNSMSVEVKPSS